MIGVDVSIWNGIAPMAHCPVWRRLFALNADAQNEERDRLYQALLDRGTSEDLASAYLDFAPLLHESEAINGYRASHPQWSHALPEILSVHEALHYASAESNDAIGPVALASLAKLLRKDPELVLPPVPIDQQRQAWEDEAASMLILTARDWAVSLEADLPGELMEADEIAQGDDEYDDKFDEWYEWATADPFRVIALEQCCEDSMPLPARERSAKLATAPEQLRLEIEAFWHQCPDHMAKLLANHIHWMARSERSRRRGSADWTPLYPLPPWWEDQEPNKTFLRWCA